MKIKCIYNTGQQLIDNEIELPGIFKETIFGLLEIGKEYLVMGIIYGEGEVDYLIDDSGIVSACPYQLFQILDNKLSSNWYFRTFSISDDIYPFQQALIGYHELCFNTNHYENLVNMEDEALRIYFRIKIEMEK